MGNVRKLSQTAKMNLEKEVSVNDKENIPKNGGFPLPADIIQEKHAEEQKRKATYDVIKRVEEQDSANRKEAESVVAASRKAAKDVGARIESSLGRGRGEREGPVYYGMNSAARRSSQDTVSRRDSCAVNDDLADEIEAIRLAADFSSRRMLNDQKKESVGSASSSRLRIRALLDKQKTQRDEDEKVRQSKRESQDLSKFVWVYR